MVAFASVVPCAVLMEDSRRPQSVSRNDGWSVTLRGPSGKCYESVYGAVLYQMPWSPQCYSGADEPRDTTPLRASLKPPCCYTAACPDGLLFGPVAVNM